MGAARAYVQENVYERLSRVPTPSEMGDDDRSVASFNGGASMSMERGGYTPRGGGGGGSVGGGGFACSAAAAGLAAGDAAVAMVCGALDVTAVDGGPSPCSCSDCTLTSGRASASASEAAGGGAGLVRNCFIEG